MADDGRFKDADSSSKHQRAGEKLATGINRHDGGNRRDRESDRRRSGAASTDESRGGYGAPGHRAASPARRPHRHRVTALDKWPSVSPDRKRASPSDDAPRPREDSARRPSFHHADSDRPARPHKRQRRKRHSPAAAENDTVARVSLPFDARALSRRDLDVFYPLFARYLDLQKGLAIEDLDEDEVRGRWKSFVGRWNRAQLAEGWYDPEMFLRVAEEQGDREWEEGHHVAESRPREREKQASRGFPSGTGSEPAKDGGYDPSAPVKQKDAPSEGHVSGDDDDDDGDDDDDHDDDEYGPAPPPGQASTSKPRAPSNQAQQGPKIPSIGDLEARRELEAEEHEARATSLRLERRAERKLHKERLEELAPRAEPGTRERRLEKKREAGAANRAFREGGHGQEEVAVGDGDLMGDDGGIEGYRKRLADAQRRKTQRELRREEEARARAAEHEQRLRAYRAREEKTVDMLRELAKQRFG